MADYAGYRRKMQKVECMMKNHRKNFEIQGRMIGIGQPPFIVAEISGNHNGDIERGLQLIEAAHHAGADAVKLQTYTPDTLTIDHDGPDFIIQGGPWDKRRLYDLYEEAHTPWEWHKTLFRRGLELGIPIFSTPFDATAVDFLHDLNVPAYKIASFELVDRSLLQKIATQNKPIIMSTGMATIREIASALETIRQSTCAPVVLLHCVSAYPAPPEEYNLKTIANLAETFDVLTGLSDHTLGHATAIAATALGASVIEKHFTISRDEGGPDAGFSLEPHELTDLISSCKDAFHALGKVSYTLAPSEKKSLTYRRSIYVVKDITRGEKLAPDNIRIIRPGFGMSPEHYDQVIGMKAKKNLKRGDALLWEVIT